MAEVIIYTTQQCPYCVRAKQLLTSKKVNFSEIRVDLDPAERQKMLEKTQGLKTVPQIFINGKHVGGCDDLYRLDQQGQLDGLLV